MNLAGTPIACSGETAVIALFTVTDVAAAGNRSCRPAFTG